MNPSERLAAVEDELRAIHEAAGDEPLTDEQQAQWDELRSERGRLQETIRRQEERREEVRSLAERPGRTEAGDGARGAPQVMTKVDPFAVLEDRSLHGGDLQRALTDANLKALEERDLGGADNERHVETLLRRHGGDTRWASNLLARSRPEYEAGFSKMMTGRQEYLTYEERAAMAVGTATAGGLLVPTHLDPTLILTNAGTSNVIRGIARVVTLTVGNVWHGVTTAGVTASWDGELVEVSDDTPALAAATVSTVQAQSLVQASIAAFEDIAGLSSDVLMLFADARDRLEGAAHATGSGSGQPKGIFTAVNASASLQVTSTTAATIGLVDLHSLYRTLPVRWRGRGTWLTNPLYSLAIKALGTAVSASFSTDITQAMAGSLLGRPLVESDDAPTTQTTTALDNEIIFGDFSGYTIVDMPGGFSVEFIPHMFNTANNLPDGRRAWFAYWRNGADATNLASFRMLVDKTSA
ncbi:phage major capsid protein [Nonomuraea typhae]|uniref:phage major capsid protein n=1 Tax=Nonomuraea typhae TaxID=2603600 RepID=UPI0012FC943F|nr:phage major capsid protein [Nonomuraea typhae]